MSSAGLRKSLSSTSTFLAMMVSIRPRTRLAVIADERCDYYHRRDAAHWLEKFNLTDDDLHAFRPLIFNPGGPSVAVRTVSKLKTNASLRLLQEVEGFWRPSAYPQAHLVYNAIMQELNLEDESADLHDILERALNDRCNQY